MQRKRSEMFVLNMYGIANDRSMTSGGPLGDLYFFTYESIRILFISARVVTIDWVLKQINNKEIMIRLKTP
jgi:hypothetical protein